MKILTISPDAGDVSPSESPVIERFRWYGSLVDQFDVIGPANTDGKTDLSDTTHLYRVGGSNKLVKVWRLVRACDRLMKQNAYIVLSTRDPYFVGLVAVYFAKKYGIGLELQVHGFEKRSWLRTRLAQYVVRHADGIRAVSERLKAHLIQDFSVNAKKILVSPIFLDGRRFAERATAMGERMRAPSDPFVFVTVSRLVPVKNIAMQIHALAKIKQAFDVKLVIVGDGPCRQELEALARERDVKKNVVFTGAVSDPTPFFHEADAFLLTSFSEGYGMAPIEAACFGLPIIMTDVGCANEVIVDEINGFVIPVHDERALVAAMKRLIQEPETQERMHQENKKLFEKLPTLQKTLRLYRESWNAVEKRGNARS
ncbi:glycosyltransferase [Patescibacteria group bacterium]|nr:glycosyltransferase [Patescibacteria group bacterium]